MYLFLENFLVINPFGTKYKYKDVIHFNCRVILGQFYERIQSQISKNRPRIDPIESVKLNFKEHGQSILEVFDASE